MKEHVLTEKRQHPGPSASSHFQPAHSFLSTSPSPNVCKENPSALPGLVRVSRLPTLGHHMTQSCILYGSYWSDILILFLSLCSGLTAFC